MNLCFYEIDNQYIDYLSAIEPHFFHNKKPRQQNESKYIGILLHIHDMDYFAPLSSFKPKHAGMKERVDFFKIKNYSVLNLNNMFPVSQGLYRYVEIQKVKNPDYRALLQAENRVIKSRQERIIKNADMVYHHRIDNGVTTSLGKRCHNFLKLEEACLHYKD